MPSIVMTARVFGLVLLVGSVGCVGRVEESWPTVSVLLPTRNRPTFLQSALNLIQQQDYKLADVEVVVFDDSEAPLRLDTSKMEFGFDLRTLSDSRDDGEAIPLADKRLRLIEEAKNDIVILWDDDDWFGPQRLRLQVGPLMKDNADMTFLGLDWVMRLQGEKATFGRLGKWQQLQCGSLAVRREDVLQVESREKIRGARLGEDLMLANLLFQTGFRPLVVGMDGQRNQFVLTRHDFNTWDIDRDLDMTPGGMPDESKPDFLPFGVVDAFLRGHAELAQLREKAETKPHDFASWPANVDDVVHTRHELTRAALAAGNVAPDQDAIRLLAFGTAPFGPPEDLEAAFDLTCTAEADLLASTCSFDGSKQCYGCSNSDPLCTRPSGPCYFCAFDRKVYSYRNSPILTTTSPRQFCDFDRVCKEEISNPGFEFASSYWCPYPGFNYEESYRPFEGFCRTAGFQCVYTGLSNPQAVDLMPYFIPFVDGRACGEPGHSSCPPADMFCPYGAAVGCNLGDPLNSFGTQICPQKGGWCAATNTFVPSVPKQQAGVDAPAPWNDTTQAVPAPPLNGVIMEATSSGVIFNDVAEAPAALYRAGDALVSELEVVIGSKRILAAVSQLENRLAQLEAALSGN